MSGRRGLLVLPTLALWQREMTRFLRQRNRITGALATPLVFWLLIGSGLGESFAAPGIEGGFMRYFFPGTVVLILLFTAIFSTVSIIEDRRDGFLQGVLVAPVARGSIVSGKCLGGMTLAAGQAALFCLAAPWAGLPLDATVAWRLAAALLLGGFALTALGFLIAWPLESTQGFHVLMNLLLIPLWLLSGAFFPAREGSWTGWAAAVNPLAYVTAAVRRAFYGDGADLGLVPSYAAAMGATAVFAVVMFLLALRAVRQGGPEGR
jgi:ABC-2 type transport system permease protein